MDLKKIIKPLFVLLSLIIFCSLFIRVCAHSETLTEYAANNPDLAYPQTTDYTAQKETEPMIEDSSRNNKKSSSEKEDITHIDNTKETDGIMEDTMDIYPERVEYMPDFYYEPLSDDIKKRITGISYPVSEENKDTTLVTAINIVSSPDEIQISYDDLRYVRVLYYNFKGIVRTGELICNEAIAQDLVEIFYELYENEYQIEQISLIDEYSGDDVLSMLDNNTSCFNYRVVDGTTSLSKHALGLAIDINPFFNPYVVYKNDGTTYISPQGSETYADRSKEFAYKIDENDLCYKLFTEHGFTWGGNWNSLKDYQHFQKVPK